MARLVACADENARALVRNPWNLDDREDALLLAARDADETREGFALLVHLHERRGRQCGDQELRDTHRAAADWYAIQGAAWCGAIESRIDALTSSLSRDDAYEEVLAVRDWMDRAFGADPAHALRLRLVTRMHEIGFAIMSAVLLEDLIDKARGDHYLSWSLAGLRAELAERADEGDKQAYWLFEAYRAGSRSGLVRNSDLASVLFQYLAIGGADESGAIAGLLEIHLGQTLDELRGETPALWGDGR